MNTEVFDLGKIGITIGGEYDNNVIYEKLTIVLYKGKSYISTKTIQGVSPEQDSKIWQLVAEAKDAYHMLVDAGKITLTEEEFLEQLVDATKGRYIVQGNVINAADEEDLTVEHSSLLGIDTLKLADRPSTDGMGYIILRKNKTFAEQVTKENTIYEIRYNFDLNGEEITIPENCILKFDGGSINNGSLKGNNTKISNNSNAQIFNNIDLTGIWSNIIAYSSWFAIGDLVLDENDRVISGTNAYKAFINLFKFDNIYINGDYYIEGHLTCHSGQTIEGNNHILKSKYTDMYTSAITIRNCCNVTINNLNCIGWSFEGTDATEWAHGLAIYDKTNDIIVTNCIFNKFRGDGICIAGSVINNVIHVPHRITINNITCDYNARQGLSLIGGCYIYIKNSKFSHTGTPDNISASRGPWAGIDVEPNKHTIDGTEYQDPINNVTIEQCEFIDNVGSGIATYSPINEGPKDIIINNCYITSGDSKGIDIITGKNITISNTSITNGNSIGIDITGKNITISNTSITNGNSIGILIKLGENITISNTSIITGQHGIYCDEAQRNNIVINNVNIISDGTGKEGIRIVANTHLTTNFIMKNVKVSGFYNYGIFIPINNLVNKIHCENIQVSHCYHNFYIGKGSCNVFYKNIISTDKGIKPDGSPYQDDNYGWLIAKGDDINTRIDLDDMLKSSSGTTNDIPTDVPKGFLYFDTTANVLKVFDGTTYKELLYKDNN